MFPAEVAITTARLKGRAFAEPALVSLLSDEAFGRAWQARQVIKQEENRSVAVMRAEDGTAYLIKSLQPKLRKRIVSFVSSSFLRIHRNLGILSRHGIPVARSLGFVAWRPAGEPEHWCQIQEYIHDAVTLEQALTSLHRNDPATQMALISETARQLGRLHQLGRYHGDMKLTNIMVRGREIYLIDTTGSRSIRLGRWHQKDLARFLVGLEEANIQRGQREKAIAVYQQYSGNELPAFMDGVRTFAKKISQRRVRRYGLPPRSN